MIRDRGKVFCGVDAQVRSRWKVLPEQAISVLMRAALPGAGGVTELQRYKSPLRKVLVAGQFGALIPGEGTAQVGREGAHCFC